MSCKKLFADQFSAAFDEENWFAPLTASIKGLTSEQAMWTEGSSNHSILQIITHLIFWNERYLQRFTGGSVPEMKGDNDSTFIGKDNSDEKWKNAREKLNKVMNDLKDAINNADESKLESSPFKDSSDSWYSVIANINIHNAYHTGQIVYIRKLQGSWSDEYGVK